MTEKVLWEQPFGNPEARASPAYITNSHQYPGSRPLIAILIITKVDKLVMTTTRIGINVYMRDYIQGYANTQGTDFSKAMLKIISVGDLCVRNVERITPLIDRAKVGSTVYATDEHSAEDFNAHHYLIEVLKQPTPPQFESAEVVTTVSMPDNRFDDFRRRATKDGIKFRQFVLFRIYYGICVIMLYHQFRAEIASAFENKKFNQDTFMEYTSKQNFLNFLDKNIFDAVHGDEIEAFEQAKSRFLATLKEQTDKDGT